MVIKGDKDRKKSKDRISELLTCSAAGEKLTTLVIGNSGNPCCFRDLASPLCILVMYASNKKA